MTLPKDLPPGAQAWARDMERKAETVKHLESVVQNLTNLLGLDYRNPARGISAGATPSIQNPLTLKLNALNDMDVRGAQDGDFIMWSSLKNKWVTGRPPSAVPTFSATNLFNNPNLAGSDMPNGFTTEAPASIYYELTGGVLALVPDAVTPNKQHKFDFSDLLMSASMVAGRAYILSFDITISSGTPTSGSSEIVMYGGPYEFSEFVYSSGVIASPYATSNRVQIPFTCTSTDGADINPYIYTQATGLAGYRVEFSQFSLIESTDTLPWANWQSTLDASVDLLALGIVPGRTYILAGLPQYSDQITTVIADSIEIARWEGPSADLSSQTSQSFTVPVGVSVLTLETTVGTSGVVGYNGINIATEPPAFFSGDTPADANYTYSWAGTPDNSASIRTPR